jgi:hypothetical protein
VPARSWELAALVGYSQDFGFGIGSPQFEVVGRYGLYDHLDLGARASRSRLFRELLRLPRTAPEPGRDLALVAHLPRGWRVAPEVGVSVPVTFATRTRPTFFQVSDVRAGLGVFKTF